MAALSFNTDYQTDYGKLEVVRPGLRRITAHNPSHFTFRGTGTYVVGEGDVAVIDPGPADPDHIDTLIGALDGERIVAVAITHTHSDHSPGLALLRQHGDFVTYGFDPAVVVSPPADYFDGFFDAIDAEIDEPDTEADKGGGEDGGSGEADHERETIDTDFVPDVVLSDGDIVHGDGWTLEAMHTPGHMSNHVCFGWSEGDGVFTGDHIMGWSTTVIPAPDGDLNAYMASLDKLLARNDQTYWPTHGAPVDDPAAFVAGLKAHRQARTDQILACLASGDTTIASMVFRMYGDKPQKLWRPAALSVLAHLSALAAEGTVQPDGDLRRHAPTDWILANGSAPTAAGE